MKKGLRLFRGCCLFICERCSRQIAFGCFREVGGTQFSCAEFVCPFGDFLSLQIIIYQRNFALLAVIVL